LIYNLISGVQRGSVLGPLLFILFINDISDKIPPDVYNKLFADDQKSYTKVIRGGSLCIFSLALDSLYNWADLWQLPISGGSPLG